MPRYLERISAVSCARAKRTVFFWHSGEHRSYRRGIYNANPPGQYHSSARPSRTRRGELEEKCADCRVKSARCPGTSHCLEARSRRRRLLEPRHAASIATRDYYGNRVTSLIPVAASHAVRFFDKCTGRDDITFGSGNERGTRGGTSTKLRVFPLITLRHVSCGFQFLNVNFVL